MNNTVKSDMIRVGGSWRVIEKTKSSKAVGVDGVGVMLKKEGKSMIE